MHHCMHTTICEPITASRIASMPQQIEFNTQPYDPNLHEVKRIKAVLVALGLSVWLSAPYSAKRSTTVPIRHLRTT